MQTLNKDSRGEIHSVAEKADVIFITSVAGARRANHYHREFGHWCLVTKGVIIYLERPFGAVGQPTQQTFKQGDLFWTGPLMEHLMLFPEETEFYCFSVGARDSASYETDTVRLDFQLDEQSETMTRADWLRLRDAAHQQGDLVQFNKANAALGM